MVCSLCWAGFLEGLAVEIGYGVVDKYQGSMKNLLLSGILGPIFVLCRDGFFWGTPWSYGGAVAAGVIIVRFFSAIVISIILVKVITAALAKTGVLKGFKCVKA